MIKKMQSSTITLTLAPKLQNILDLDLVQECLGMNSDQSTTTIYRKLPLIHASFYHAARIPVALSLARSKRVTPCITTVYSQKAAAEQSRARLLLPVACAVRPRRSTDLDLRSGGRTTESFIRPRARDEVPVLGAVCRSAVGMCYSLVWGLLPFF